MDITPLIPQGRQIIQSYTTKGFKVSGVAFSSAIIVLPSKTAPWMVNKNFADLTVEDFSPFFEMAEDIDVVLLGAGGRGGFFPPSLQNHLKQKGLMVETMDTGAACRTYNVLMAEGRRVAAALLPVL